MISGRDRSRSVCPVGAVSKMTRSYPRRPSSMRWATRSISAASSAPGECRVSSIWRSISGYMAGRTKRRIVCVTRPR